MWFFSSKLKNCPETCLIFKTKFHFQELPWDMPHSLPQIIKFCLCCLLISYYSTFHIPSTILTHGLKLNCPETCLLLTKYRNILNFLCFYCQYLLKYILKIDFVVKTDNQESFYYHFTCFPFFKKLPKNWQSPQTAICKYARHFKFAGSIITRASKIECTLQI